MHAHLTTHLIDVIDRNGMKVMDFLKSFQEKADELRDDLINAMGDFSEVNPDAPAQVYTAALGETFVQFALSHSGPEKTLYLIDHMREAVNNLAVKTAH